jgi:hypothetical protein
MESILQTVNVVVTSAVILAAAAFIIGDSAARVEWFRDKFPRLQKVTDRKNSVVYLLLVAIVLQVIYIADLGVKETSSVPNIYLPPFATIPAPVIHEEERPVLASQRELTLRDKANKLADELQDFTNKRDAHLPPIIEKSPMTPDQVQAAAAPQTAYRDETYGLYVKRFEVRVITMVAEFKALGLDVSSIEKCAPFGFCSPTSIPVELHALAVQLDDNDNVRR